MRKKVNFSIFVDVFIIEPIGEIIYDKNELWWEEKELNYFQLLAKVELRNFMYINKLTNFRDAMTRLYQP